MRILRTIFIAACAAALSAGCVAQKSRDVAPCFIGVATMLADRSLYLELRAEIPGRVVGDATFNFSPEHERYAETLEHIGPMEPGESKPVPCWENND